MRYLITGRTGCGKQHLMQKMKDRGIDNIHIVTPNRIQQVANTHPDSAFSLIFIQADYDKRKEAAANSGILGWETQFTEDCKKEHEMFAEFENTICQMKKDNSRWHDSPFPKNILQLYPIENDFEDATLSVWAEILLRNKRKYDNILKIVRCSVEELGIMRKGKDGKNTVNVVNENNEEISAPIEIFANNIIQDDEGLLLLIRSVLESADITLTPVPISTNLS